MICETREKVLVSEIGEYFYVLLAVEIIVNGKMGESRATQVGKTGCHEYLCLDHWSKVLHIDKTKFSEILFLAFVLRVVETEYVLEFFVGCSCYTAVVSTTEI